MWLVATVLHGPPENPEKLPCCSQEIWKSKHQTTVDSAHTDLQGQKTFHCKLMFEKKLCETIILVIGSQLKGVPSHL